jgi:signal transduction histidine kinase
LYNGLSVPTIGRVVSESSIEVLVRFARLASEAGAAAGILPLLADALVEHVPADAVAVLEIREHGMAEFVASSHLPEELRGMRFDPDVIGEELGAQLLAACRERFAHVRSSPLVSGGGLFGSVAMFFGAAMSPDLTLAGGLIDLAGIALGSDAQLKRLIRSHADLRAAQDVLARTEKLRALGQMAAGVSHDLKNILNPLSMHLQLIERAIERKKPADALESLEGAKQVLTRGLQTIERLRDYSRQTNDLPTEKVDLNRLAHEAGEIARPRMAARGGRLNRIKEELGSPPPILGRAGDIVSALVNLIVNAIEVLPDGGTITLRTGEAERGAWVEVADEGPGMPPEVERRVFEPFFTTKGAEGTGLGLAMVYACVQRHGGSVKLETEVGKGTTFRLWFPGTMTAPPPR